MLKPEKLYYKIGEVAKMFGIKTSLIRYWEKEFSIIKPKKTKNGIRLFTRKDIDHFELIYHLIKEKGMTINGAREYIKKQKGLNNFEKLEVINTLKRTKAFLQDIKDLLDKRNIIQNNK
jgi:DNA-binding transcriptional MerR regulator